MRKLMLNLVALAVIGTGGALLSTAEPASAAVVFNCYQDGELCSDSPLCCVDEDEGRCYDTCPPPEG